MAAHRVQKFGKSTKAAQLLEIRQAAPAEHPPGLSQHKGVGFPASVQIQLYIGLSITLLHESSQNPPPDSQKWSLC